MTGRAENDEAEFKSGLDRRDFMKSVGKFAVVTPPTVMLLLDVSMNSPAVAGSGGKPGWGYGNTNQVHTGPPGLNKKI